MKVKLRRRLIVSLLLFALLPAISILAAPQTRAELKDRFEQRHGHLNRLKEQGKVGETFRGFIESVKDESALNQDERKLMEAENEDRRRLYDLIAAEVVKGEKKLSPEKVAERNARRNFVKADPNHFLKTSDDVWMKRNDSDRLKREGKVGETSEGYIEAVEGAKLNDRQRLIVEGENRIRRGLYERRAWKNDSTSQEEGQRAGRENIDQAKRGEYVKAEDGAWTKR
jgi:uncharacterized protein YdbL (DUF1318 family)